MYKNERGKKCNGLAQQIFFLNYFDFVDKKRAKKKKKIWRLLGKSF